MSVGALLWAFNQPIPTSERFVLVVLGDHADQDGSCWPSKRLISSRTGMSEATVKRALRSLQERGLISVEDRTRSNGSTTSNRYYLQVGGHHDPRVNLTPPRGHHDPLPPVIMTPPIEPSGEPSSEPGIDLEGILDPLVAAREEFEGWWKIYPRKVVKQAAIKAWKARRADKSLPEISDLMARTERFAASVKGKEPEFIPHPATWLNQHRWEDVSIEARSPQDGGPSEAYLAWLKTPEGIAHMARKAPQ